MDAQDTNQTATPTDAAQPSSTPSAEQTTDSAPPPAPAPAAAAAPATAPTSNAMAATSLGSAARAASSATAAIAKRPLSGLFGVNKPSGPTSMSLLDQLKPLFASSPLFADADGKPVRDHNKKRGKWGKGRRGGGFGGAAAGAPKIGQGGTLDPLADGVLVIGVGAGTKHLQKYLDCTKEYRTTALLGSATTSYDCCDPILSRAPFHHVNPHLLGSLLPNFTGSLLQFPPLYSAVRIDGKRLFEYAREGLELPRPIEARKVRVDELRLVDWLPAGRHAFKEPEREVPDDEKALVGRVRQIAGVGEGMGDTRKVDEDGEAGAAAAAEADETTPANAAVSTESGSGLAAAAPDLPEQTEADGGEPAPSAPPAFTLEMTVSSGTYVRSIVHDLAMAAGSAAHVQVLTRTRQGEWSIDTPAVSQSAVATTQPQPADAGEAASSNPPVIKGNCLPWEVFADAIDELNKEQREPGYQTPRDDQGLREWERELLRVIVPV
ncbi:uncharacterized protein PFL1_04121 [Pseudozyma flocculosa PF-1]|uniref:tRNA pseudouridine(55) synthase n=2 Tax=Pseudozyma flocculosa TaxID=84751 RepID=A0A5C3EWC4_9BASI|nr:uncharacterized protein PFL1_04121 [Pseudozyma flocculosa PF-1]EPQ28294.1 hypothetical protein PFL1_04121 [Pseudozyma flocculosa PF-1]SPO35439.1 related to tRNA pseudouridine synthase B [Pseudozyma flocculosa]